MSDGPHRSLPMRRQWKILAERAAKAAFSSRDVCEALPQALIKDFGEAQLDSVRDVLVGGDQGLLFQEDRVEQLDAIRPQCRGSAVGNIFIDCAIEIAARGETGAALSETCVGFCRNWLANWGLQPIGGPDGASQISTAAR